MSFVRSIRPPLARPLFGLALAASLLLQSAVVRADEVVGRVLMAIGKVELERASGTVAAKKDTEILAGDTIVTGSTSNAQIRFKDGAIIAFRPETEFRVDEYKFSGKADGSEKASVSLLKGGVRAVTGAIGRGNRDNLKVNAVVATVGIRGTGFNITFCGASCKATNPSATEGLYAGVFEGKVAVSNEGGATSDLGVNRFAFVKDKDTAPILLIAPPSFLKDSLEGQVRVQPKALALNAASENAQNAVAVVKAPTVSSQSGTVSADKVQAIPTPLKQPEAVTIFPTKFFEVAEGSGVLPPVSPREYITKLRAAEFDPRTEQIQIDLDSTVTSVLASDSLRVYSINNTYIAPSDGSAWREGGREGTAIAWGRWAARPGSTASLQIGRYGTVTLEGNQGWHYIYGAVATQLPSGSVTMNIIGGSSPTEVRSGAEGGWRLSGGVLNVNYAGSLAGNLNLFKTGTAGSAEFLSRWSGNFDPSRPGAITGYSTSTTRVSGALDLCVRECPGIAYIGFYGTAVNGVVTPSHAGMTYQFNTGTYQVQGVAVFR